MGMLVGTLVGSRRSSAGSCCLWGCPPRAPRFHQLLSLLDKEFYCQVREGGKEHGHAKD